MAGIFLLADDLARKAARAVRITSNSTCLMDHKRTYRLSEADMYILVNEYHQSRQNFHPNCSFSVSRKMVETFLQYLAGKLKIYNSYFSKYIQI